jgi:hypothetical protein
MPGDHTKFAAFRNLFVASCFTILAACGGGGGGLVTSSTPQSAVPPPTNTPAVPAGVTATGGNANVSLTWTASPSATSYHVKRSTTTGGPYTQVFTAAAATFTDTALTNGTHYFYVASALNSGGESANSSQVTATPVAPVAGTSTPLITSFTPTSGSVGTVVTLTGSGLTGVSTAQSGLNIYAGTTFINTVHDGVVNVISDIKATFTIPADGGTGQIFLGNSTVAGFAPSEFTVIPTTAPPVPTGLTATGGNANVQLGWTATLNAAAYAVKRSTTSGGPYTVVGNPTSNLYADNTVTNNTQYFYVVAATDAIGSSANSAQVSATPAVPPAGTVTVTVTPSSTHAISPYIYGLNFATTVTGAPPSVTLDRAGGNRWTAYNWENNASNAGSDFIYENDAFLSSSLTPAAGVTSLISGDQVAGMASLVTFQMQGLVAADESGPVSTAAPPDMTRFKTVVNTKGSAFTLTPPTTDANVYMDEFIWALDQKFPGQGIFGTSPSTQPVFVSLDNEPELWNSTHLEVQGAAPVTSDAYIAKTISLSKALKTQFPNLVIFGPAHYGFFGIYAWNGELAPTPTGNNWFPDKYLPAIKAASTTFGKPLVDVYDFHWYPEATDNSGNRVVDLNGPTLSADQVTAIVQAPRSLWDTTYSEDSWVSVGLGGPIFILGRLQSRITAENPGMKISITEYNNGGAQHIAGTIAQADNLGIFGAQALFAATMWPLTATEPYLLAGFRAFRDFDGANHNFGDTSVETTSGNIANVAVYVSTDSARPGRVVMVAINRSLADQATTITGQPLAGTAHLYRMSASSASGQTTVQPVAAGSQAVSGSSMALTLPAMSVTTIDIF